MLNMFGVRFDHQANPFSSKLHLAACSRAMGWLMVCVTLGSGTPRQLVTTPAKPLTTHARDSDNPLLTDVCFVLVHNQYHAHHAFLEKCYFYSEIYLRHLSLLKYS